MKRFALLILISLGVVFAQSPERVVSELRRTDEVIERAQLVVEPSGNEEAQTLLRSAIEIQNSAWEGYRGRRYRWALSRTLAARQRAWQALDMVVNNPERVRQEIERTAQLMQEAEPVVNRVDEQRVKDLWQMARSEQAAAEENFRAQRYRMALRFTITARQHTGVVLKLLRQTLSLERVELELVRTERIQERAKGPIQAAKNVRAQEMFNRAGAWQVQARNRFRERFLGRALRLTLASRDLTLRAWVLVNKEGSPELLETTLSEIERLIELWSEEFQKLNDGAARKLFAQALNHHRAARELQKAGDFAAALKEATQAQRLMNRALEVLETGNGAPDSE